MDSAVCWHGLSLKKPRNQQRTLARKMGLIVADKSDTLDLLQRDARTTIKELSAALGLSTTPIHARVKRLERQGVIRGYVALLMTVPSARQLKQEMANLLASYRATG